MFQNISEQQFQEPQATKSHKPQIIVRPFCVASALCGNPFNQIGALSAAREELTARDVMELRTARNRGVLRVLHRAAPILLLPILLLASPIVKPIVLH